MLPNKGDFREEIETVLRSKTFAKSNASRDLLVFLSSKLLKAEGVSSSTIANEFLKLPAPNASPKNAIVRVQVSRLRTLLCKYYASEGADSAHILAIPSGSFNLEMQAGVADQSNFAPCVTLLEITNIGGDSFQSYFCDGIKHELAHLLSNSRDIRLFLGETERTKPSSSTSLDASNDGVSTFELSGAVRSTPDAYRVIIYLVDRQTSQVVWSKEFTSSLDSNVAYLEQREIAEQVTSILISLGGVIDRYLRRKTPNGSPHAAVLHFYDYLDEYSPQALLRAKELLLKAVETAPLYSEAWACLSGVYCNEYMFGPVHDKANLDLAMTAAKRSINICPDTTMGLYALALAHYYQDDFASFFEYAERAIAHASYRVDVLATIGLHIAYAGQWEKGIGYLERAIHLNPNHPNWCWFPLAANFYRQNKYSEALNAAHKLNMPDFEWEALFLAAIHGRLGNNQESLRQLEKAKSIKPEIFSDLGAYVGRVFKDKSFIKHFLQGISTGTKLS